MPSLSTVVSSYVKRVIDSLRTGPGWSSASLSRGSGTSQFLVTARAAGAGGNSLTVEVTAPGGTAALTVTATGNAITIALSVSGGTPVDADNTALKICNAINASATASPLVKASVTGSGAGFLAGAVAVASLSGGVTGTDSQPANFLRAQDLASVMELLQDALDQPATMTALTGSSETVIQDGANTFLADQQVGNYVVFKSNTTTVALRGVSSRILANTDSALTVALLPAAAVNGDTYSITAGMIDDVISDLREGKALGDSPAGNAFGDFRMAKAGLQRLVDQLGLVAASGTLTYAGNVTGAVAATGTLTVTGGGTQIANGNTVTIGTKVYTWQTVLTNVDGNVLIGANDTAALANLRSAINLTAGGGSTYAAATTIHPTVTATASNATTLSAAAKAKGAAGNSIATTETGAETSWGAVTLTGGVTGDTVTIDGKVYTYEVVLTDVDGNLLVDSTAALSRDNLMNAINLGSGAGTKYATSTTLHPTVKATSGSGTLIATAKAKAGAGGNTIATTETGTQLSWGAVTLTGGTSASLRAQTVASLLTASGSTTTVVELAGGPFRIDQFRGMSVTISGEIRSVVGNDESSMLLDKALTSAPTSSVAVSVTMPEVVTPPSMQPGRVMPGGQPTDNRMLAVQLEQAEAAVIAHVLPA